MSVLTGVSLSTSATYSSGPGVYDITASGGNTTNYLVSYINGELLVTSNGIPSTVEYVLSAGSPTFTQPISVETTEISGAQDQGPVVTDKKTFVVIPDDELETGGNTGKGALIAITESLKKLFGIADI